MENKKTNKDLKDEKLKDVKLTELFDRFDNTKCTEFLTHYALMKLKDRPNWENTLVAKIKYIKNFISVAEHKINAMYSKMLGTKFTITKNVAFYADANMPQIFTKMNVSQTGNGTIVPIMLNIPLDRLLNMSGFEIYALISASATAAAESIKENKGKVIDVALSSQNNTSLTEHLEELHDNQKDNRKLDDNREKAKILLTKYLLEFLPKACGGEFKEFDDISDVVAEQILDGLTPEEIEEMTNFLFDMSQFDDEALKKVGVFTGKEVYELRTDKMFEKAQNLWKDPNKQPEALNQTKQYQALMSLRLQKEFIDLARSADKPNANSVDLKRLCIDFANEYMSSNGLKPITITFKNEGELGTYIDAVTSQSINLNLSKINTVTELISTLSHELSHAVESSINKSEGKTTREGFGLDESVSSDISRTSLPEASGEYEVLKELNNYCYRINPHERTARYGEIAGLKFMHALATSDKMKSQLAETVQSFEDYQRKTIHDIERLSKKEVFDDLVKRVELILKSPNIPEADKEMFRVRLNYLKAMAARGRLNTKMEEKSLQEVARIAGVQQKERGEVNQLDEMQMFSNG